MKHHYQYSVISTLFSTCIALLSSSVGAVEQGDWLVRVGVGYVSPNDDSGALKPTPNLSGVEVDSATNLALNITYMVTPTLSAELLGALPFNHEIKADGALKSATGLDKIGETDQLPPTLMLNYNFSPTASIRPYVGAGVNYTTFFNTESTSSLDQALGETDIDLDSSWGFAVQGGVDVDLNEDWFANASVWYMDISTDATLKSAGTSGSTNRSIEVDINPVVLFVGIGKRF